MWASIAADCKGNPELGHFLESWLPPNFVPLRRGGSDIHLGPLPQLCPDDQLSGR